MILRWFGALLMEIAAPGQALPHLDATVLTRNVRDFELTPVRIETY